MDKATLADVCEAIVDCEHKTAPLAEFGYPSIRTTDIKNGRLDIAGANRVDEATYQEWTARRKPLPGDLILAREAPVGEVGIIPDGEQVVLGQRTVLICPDRAKVDPRYLLYTMIGPGVRHQMSSQSAGSTVAHLNMRNIRALQLPVLPPLRTQRAIASVLGSLDDKIEQNRRTARALERLARAIFRAWFVDFEPVKAKAAGAASFPSMPQAVFEALPTTFTDSDLGPVPEGWKVKAMSECMVLTMGQSPPSEHYNEVGEGLPFHQGVTDYGFRFPTHRVYCTVAARLAEAKDVLLSVRAPVGRINVADQRLVLGRGLAGVRHPRGAQSFVLHQLSHAFAEEDAMGDGTIYKAVTKQFLSQMATLSPTTSVIDCFESIAQPLDAQVFALEMETRNLVSLRDYLLPQLLSGQVPVEVGNA